ncbi:MAG TPA: hypothetical protein VGI43_04745 [Mucilaginibacter sp.]
MKLLNKKLIVLFTIILLVPCFNGFSQGAGKGNLSVAINYFVVNNKVPYLLVKVKTKINGRFQPVGGIGLKLFLDKDTTGTFIGKAVTNDKGEAASMIPSSLKNKWGTTTKHTFLAQFDGDKKYNAASADLTVAKAKILIGTTSGKSIAVKVLEMKDTAWVPVKGVEIKIAVRRLGGDLPVNETPTFTTDSTGQVSADFKRDSIPGGETGKITLVAKIEDNDQYGNLSIEKTVPWGSKFVSTSDFYKRALFATRDKAPIWLIFISSGIIIAVWMILILLVRNIFKIKKLGKEIQ